MVIKSVTLDEKRKGLSKMNHIFCHIWQKTGKIYLH